MSAEEIERRIQDTTGFVEPALASSTPPEPELCSCGIFSVSTEGSALLLKKCNACFEKLQEELRGDSPSNEARDQSPLVPSDEAESPSISDIPPASPGQPSTLSGDSIVSMSEEMTPEEINGALVLAMTDSSKSCAIPLNGLLETFLFLNDPINKRKCKLFKRKSWEDMFPLLYWYVAFGVYLTPSTQIVTPCIVFLKEWGDKPFVLYAILETMCNRPRYDGLCVDHEKGEVHIVEYLVSSLTKTDLTMTFDRSKSDR